jgi:hypothetical protein
MKPDPLIYIEPLPDREEKVIRAVCGFFLGVIVGGYICLRMYRHTPWLGVFVLVLVVVGCTYGAVRYGDKFWWGLVRWWR